MGGVVDFDVVLKVAGVKPAVEPVTGLERRAGTVEYGSGLIGRSGITDRDMVARGKNLIRSGRANLHADGVGGIRGDQFCPAEVIGRRVLVFKITVVVDYVRGMGDAKL